MKEFFDPASYIFTYISASYDRFDYEIEAYSEDVAEILRNNGFAWKFNFHKEYLCTNINKVLPYNNAKFKDEIHLVSCSVTGLSYRTKDGWTIVPDKFSSNFFKDRLVYL
ncbi:hypothetical protein FDI40_gp505 [Agrobacterium phage Atu_ph07]|uniref:Uncharacterized protein n=1 Tax=Agrobacterium phage Atu_ph07 TaxID=2024264 RepID=A0A2L0V0E0_9CAUD|nr:hypothetical protein FDI40_gp505 [Agrobacterium phage Atu_ph07]AUZ95264.1 hypothetical protein [Agrobacterium phage Atu_ph07]